jgi:hypothetical protein
MGQWNNFQGFQQWYEVMGVIEIPVTETTVCNGLTMVSAPLSPFRMKTSVKSAHEPLCAFSHRQWTVSEISEDCGCLVCQPQY